MRPVIYARKPKGAGTRAEDDTPVVIEAIDMPDAVDMTQGSEQSAGGRGGRSDVDTTPIPQVEGSGPTTTPRGRKSQSTGLRQITADRPIFTLSVAADLLGLHPRTLRIYEEKGLVIPARTGGNRRRYSQLDIEKFQAIRMLTRGGVNLEGVRIILDMAVELSRLGSNPTAIIERNLQDSDD
jgi:MerR family transcriptional regulator/heat shock protein HspR